MRPKPNQGFSLLELTLVVGLVAILWLVLQGRVQNLRERAYLAVFKNVAGSFRAGIQIAHGIWFAKGARSSVKTVIYTDGKIVGVTPEGWPINGIFGAIEGSAEGCAEVWNAVLSRHSSMASTNDREMFQASYEKPICIFALNSRPGYHITYNVNTGGVAVITKIEFK